MATPWWFSGAQHSRKHFADCTGAPLRKWQSWTAPDRDTESTNSALIPGKNLYSVLPLGMDILGLLCPVKTNLDLGWKYLRDCIALLVSQDWKNTNAKNAARTSWSQGLQMRSHCWSVLCWAPNLTLLFHLLLLFWAKKCSISFNSLHTVLRQKKILHINESPEMKCFSGIALRLLMFLYPSSEYIQPLWVFGLKSLATPTLSFPEQPPFSCMSYWTGIVGEQMETMCKSPALLLPELWARIKSCIWAAFWLWRWHRQEAV